MNIGRPQHGETLVVSAAAGSVGSIVGQIGKIKGCRVVGIAGGAEKGHWLTAHLGFDAAVDYKQGGVFKALREAAPKGVDVYFDNVGGDILEACLPQMNLRGRIVCCGAISQYDGAPAAAGPRGVPGLIVVKRLLIQGFVVTDHFGERDKATADLSAWVRDGKLKVEEDVIDGLENTPAALIGLLAGENRGKRMVKVSLRGIRTRLPGCALIPGPSPEREKGERASARRRRGGRSGDSYLSFVAPVTFSRHFTVRWSLSSPHGSPKVKFWSYLLCGSS